MKKVFASLSLVFCLTLSSFSKAQTTQPYFQQQVDHVINVALDDNGHKLEADITTIYKNNSPDALNEIWMHLWPNAYSSAETALAKQQFRDGNLFMFYAMAKDMGGIEGIDFKVDGAQVNWEFDAENPDIALIKLASPLAPGGTIEIATPFTVNLPTGKISRLGHIGQSYQITQWYPKPAVYDRDGWHPMPYLNQGEFYSEYGSFDVYITLPRNYTVGATGDLIVDPASDNALEHIRLNKLNAETRKYYADRTVYEEFDKDIFPESSNETKTLHYYQENVHDFAWFADKRYRILKDNVALPHSGREVTTWLMFTPNEEHLWKDAIDYINKSTYYYSLWNGDYPYHQVTAVDGTISAGGGMEYPNVTVIGESGGDFGLNTVIAHEVGHNWFYGILGSNERTNAWMDEGLNSFNETRYLNTFYNDTIFEKLSANFPTDLIEKLDLTDFEYRWIDELSYVFPARFGVDQPLQCHSDDFTSLNYGAMVYKKTAAVFSFLQQYIGVEEFDKAMQAYFEEWKFKHPSPSDLQASLEKSTDKDLEWFFDGWIKTKKQNDWKVCSISGTNISATVKVKNVGEQISPVEVVGFNGPIEVIRKWIEPAAPGETREIELVGASGPITRVVIDPDKYSLDYNKQNNTINNGGVFKKVEPIELKMLTRLENGERTQVYWTPAGGWNAINGLMLGASFHNTSLPPKDFEWMVTPMASLPVYTSKVQLSGVARFALHKGSWNATLNASRFSTLEYLEMGIPDMTIPEVEAAPMNRIQLSVNKKFNKVPNSEWKSELGLNGVVVEGFMDSYNYQSNPLRRSYALNYSASKLRGNIIGLSHMFDFKLRRYDVDQTSPALIWPYITQKKSATRYTFHYGAEYIFNESNKYLKLNLISSAFLSNDISYMGMQTCGINTGFDPMADALMLDRGATSGLLSHQAPLMMGALPVNHFVSTGYTSVRLDYDFYSKGDLFVGYLFADNDELVPITDLVAGLTYNLGPVKVQMPLYSNQIMDAEKYEPWKYWMFSLKLRELNPFNLLRGAI